jgi:hypothetical protein
MSGPVTERDLDGDRTTTDAEARAPTIEVLRARETRVGPARVMRGLPRARRTVGAWCLLDHGHGAADEPPMAIGPHPHIGLQTVTWLLDGEIVHTDSLGSEQVVRPGELNLMSAGAGIQHAEDGRQSPRHSHAVQLWLAQPDATRFAPPRFEHFDALPVARFGAATATVLIGALDAVRSPAHGDARVMGADLVLDGAAVLPLAAEDEHGLYVLEGTVAVDGTPVGTDELARLESGRDQIALVSNGPARALLLGGEPLPVEIEMWWNFVARTRAEIETAYADWQARAARFGTLESTLARIDAPKPFWMPS